MISIDFESPKLFCSLDDLIANGLIPPSCQVGRRQLPVSYDDSSGGDV